MISSRAAPFLPPSPRIMTSRSFEASGRDHQLRTLYFSPFTRPRTNLVRSINIQITHPKPQATPSVPGSLLSTRERLRSTLLALAQTCGSYQPSRHDHQSRTTLPTYAPPAITDPTLQTNIPSVSPKPSQSAISSPPVYKASIQPGAFPPTGRYLPRQPTHERAKSFSVRERYSGSGTFQASLALNPMSVSATAPLVCGKGVDRYRRDDIVETELPCRNHGGMVRKAVSSVRERGGGPVIEVEVLQ